jgi:prolyl oligopeptidase
MCPVMSVPFSPVEPVTDLLHGVPITDPYRWLEDQNSSRTRDWIEAQTMYARSYLDALPGRDGIRDRIRELLAVEVTEPPKLFGHHAFYRKRLAHEEQACIYVQNLQTALEELLIDSREFGGGEYASVHPLRLSPNGALLLYEIKQGGERSGEFALFDIAKRVTLPDTLPRGHLRGFAFAPDCQSFYYVHDALQSARPFYRAAFHHQLGRSFSEDQEVFCAGEDQRLRLYIISSGELLGFFVCRYLQNTESSLWLRSFASHESPRVILKDFPHYFVPLIHENRILALTDLDAANYRIVEMEPYTGVRPSFVDLVPQTESRIDRWFVTKSHLVVSYVRGTQTQIVVFSPSGQKLSELPVHKDQTVRIVGASFDRDEITVERESFTEPIQIFRCSLRPPSYISWASRNIPFDPLPYDHREVQYPSKDGTKIPMFLVGRRDILSRKDNPTILTGYGGYGIPMTPQFSVFVAFLLERGCIFALPNIRGGSEFGAAWHNAARGRNRQTACDDLLSGAQWLIAEGPTAAGRLAIFGGSNSGLLAAAAITERPEMFCAAVLLAPLTDMLRYHLVDNAHVWKDEFGTSDDPDDFASLLRFSPYHRVRDAVVYPATLVVSGDADGNCNPFHARKLTARLQSASPAGQPVVLDYNTHRGHSPVLPLSDRIAGLTDRMAFLCQHLGVSL